MDPDLVKLIEGVGITEVFLVEFHRLYCDVEDEVGKILKVRLVGTYTIDR